MRPALHSRAAVLLGCYVTACAVYTDDSLRPLGGDVSRAGSSSSSAGGGGASNISGSSPGTAGAKPSGGSPTSQAGSEPGGGEPPTVGGAPGDAGGDHAGGEASGGAGAEPAPGGSAPGGAGSGGSAPGNVAGTSQGGSAGTGGTAGTGGNPPTGPSCDDHPLTARSSWVVTSLPLYDTGPPSYLTDNKTTRWTTGKAQSGNEWLQVDFGQAVTLSQINLQQAEANANDYPRVFTITVSNVDENLTGTPQLSGMGKSGVSTTILLPTFATGRFLLIEQTGASLSWWSAVELEVSCVDPE